MSYRPSQTTCHHLGWIPVEQSVMINYDLESNPLEIKTNSDMGSGEKIKLFFYTAQETNVDANIGGVYVEFLPTPRYWIYRCTEYIDFAAALPTTTEKIWRVTVTKSSGVRLQVHCNEEEVINVLLSETTCTDGSFASRWSNYWTQDMAKILFHFSDTASDYYRPYTAKGKEP